MQFFSVSYLYEGVSNLIVDGLGGGIRSVSPVEGEVLGRCGVVLGVDQGALHDRRVHEDHGLQKEKSVSTAAELLPTRSLPCS